MAFSTHLMTQPGLWIKSSYLSSNHNAKESDCHIFRARPESILYEIYFKKKVESMNYTYTELYF